ncbi:hypothetical protein [Candidatus Poriferisocius sp.]|uniref:hypothetical protein n=1 Tax=Candidatus Poriferisocius sp. TaxID=3101276 RepID=UPI003B52BE91
MAVLHSLFGPQANQQLSPLGQLGRPLGPIIWLVEGRELPSPVASKAEPMHRLALQIEFECGSRMTTCATLALNSLEDDTRHEITFEKQFNYRMIGIGYMHHP